MDAQSFRAPSSPSDPVRLVPDIEHWVFAIVGILDQAFHLREDEQTNAEAVVVRLLRALRIPERADPAALPMAVVWEMASGLYSRQLESAAGDHRRPRRVESGDVHVSVAAWRETLLRMLLTAYPELEPVERMAAAKVFSDLLVALGLPERASSFLPESVLRTARQVDGP